ncbi:MAG: phosphoenolpyruvate carboxykinase, partial [Gammaproteobacteria bacterium]
RQDEDGNFMWPGFGDNMRVLDWVLERCRGNAPAQETPIGYVPTSGSVNISGLDIDDATMSRLSAIDTDAWLSEIDDIEEYLQSYGDQLPQELLAQVDEVRSNLQQSAS